MFVFNGMQNLRLRFKASLIFTILFAGSWCLSQTSGNLFWFCISSETYVRHILIWIFIIFLIFATLELVAKRKPHIEKKVVLFFFVLSLLNIMDYGIRSIFGVVSKWPDTVLICWSLITLMFPFIAGFFALKIKISYSVLEKVINICILPSVLFIYYALPSEFTTLKIEKPLKNGVRPPVHFILFDMLSYDFMFQNEEINPKYTNFRSFSKEASIYLNTYSPASTTGQVIPRLLSGVDFEKTGHNANIWQVQKVDASKVVNISSCESIFSLFDNVGYNVFLRAFALPYLNNFHQYIQSGEVHPYDTLWRSGMHSLIWPVLYPGGIQHQKTTNCILKDYLKRIIEKSENTFFYLHWNIPHDPFIYESNGKMMSRLELTKQLINGSDRRIMYEHQLTGTDQILGTIIQTIKQSDTYDESLIVVTSDHNIKGFGFDMKHIPLIIKWPHQKKAIKVFSKITSLDIYQIFNFFVKSQKLDRASLLLQSNSY